MSDPVLGGVAARHSSILYGNWLLDIPTEPILHIRRYGINSVDSNASTSNDNTLLDIDQLEHAWRKVNDTLFSFTLGEDDISSVLEHPCAIIANNNSDHGSGGIHSSRELWVFALDSNQLENLVDLQELEPRSDSIPLSQLVTCQQHGHDFSCLQRKKIAEPSCFVTLKFSREVRRIWELFACALVERLAWRTGKRISLSSSGVVDNIPSAIPTLRPFSITKLLLTIHPAPPTIAASSACTLQPLNLPTIRLDSITITPAQDSRLSTAFETALGSSWKSGRFEAKTRARLSGLSHPDWSVFWVPLVNGEPLSTKALGKLTPRQLIDRWKRSQGIITVWPTHLCDERGKNSLRMSNTPVQSSLPFATSSLELMGISSGVFDIMSTYREPPLIDLTDDDPDPDPDLDLGIKDEEDQTMDGESISISIMDQDPNSTIQESSPKSDLDDLFSAHSNSPGPPELLDEDDDPLELFTTTTTTATTNAQQNDMLMKPQTLLSIPMSSSRSRDSIRSKEDKMDSKPEDLTNQITEDDFAFFDSPNATQGHANEGEEMETDMPITVMEPPVVVEEVVAGTDALVGLINENAHPFAISSDEHVELQHPAEQQSNATDVSILETLPISPLHQKQSTKHPRNHFPPGDIIPKDFEPVELAPSNSKHTFSYSLPSPAPTPEGFRPDLLERLKPKEKEYNYTSSWGLEVDPSEMDEDENYTGPPTPESFLDTDDEVSVRNTPLPGISTIQRLSTSGEEAVQYNGVPCLSTEWLRIKDDRKAANDLCRLWHQSWEVINKEASLPSLPTPSPTTSEDMIDLPPTLDVERFVGQLVGNQALRSLILSHEKMDYLNNDPDTSVIIEGGITLSDLDQDLEIRHLTAPSVNVGFAGSIMRLSISGLSYWTEIGLQPAGGEKDVEAICICDKSDEAKVAAGQFLADIGVVYENDYRLGYHRLSDQFDKGVLAISMDSLGDTLRTLDGQLTEPTVVYIMLTNPISRSLILSVIEGFAQPNHLIQIITPSSLPCINLPSIAMEVYERLSRPLHSIHVRGEEIDTEEKTMIYYPAYTLGPSDGEESIKPQFQLSYPIKSFDVLNRTKTIHIAYTYDRFKRLLLCSAMDNKGEAWKIGSWIDQDTSNSMTSKEVIDKIWGWSKGVAGDWATGDYQLTICKFDLMSIDEIIEWREFLSKRSTKITLLMIDPSSHQSDWSGSGSGRIPRPRGIANIPPSSLLDHNARLVDTSLSGHCAILHNVRIPIDVPSSFSSNTKNYTEEEEERGEGVETIYPLSSFILTTGQISNTYHIIYAHNQNKEEEESVINDYYKLWTIGKKRSGVGEDCWLPCHLQFCFWGIKGLDWLTQSSTSVVN